MSGIFFGYMARVLYIVPKFTIMRTKLKDLVGLKIESINNKCAVLSNGYILRLRDIKSPPKTLLDYLRSLGLRYYIDKRSEHYRIKVTNALLSKSSMKNIERFSSKVIEVKNEMLLNTRDFRTTVQTLIIRTSTRPSLIFKQ